MITLKLQGIFDSVEVEAKEVNTLPKNAKPLNTVDDAYIHQNNKFIFIRYISTKKIFRLPNTPEMYVKLKALI